MCTTCIEAKDVDLVSLAEQLGPTFDLWNRRPRCKFTEGCPGRVVFLHGGRGSMSPMKD